MRYWWVIQKGSKTLTTRARHGETGGIGNPEPRALMPFKVNKHSATKLRFTT
jgi:hypothetical protein